MAADINSVVLIGRLTRDIEVRYTPTGVPVGKIGLANNRRTKKGEQWIEETNFFDITLFGKMAESLTPYLTKGQQICVEGELRFESWEKEGQKFSRVGIIANNLQLLGSRPSGNGSSVSQNSSYSGNNNTMGGYNPSQSNMPSSVPKDPHSFDEDIPF